MNKDSFELDISSEVKRFDEHLSLEDNNQIIFSGIFGIGKTYFLSKFFKEKKDNYELFYLSPIHYSISQNEDIIEYIKYDIAFNLLEKLIDFEKIDFKKSLTSQVYIINNFQDIVGKLAKNWGKIGKRLSSVIEILKEYEKAHNDFQIDEQKKIIDFLKEITLTKGSIFEENEITELISDLIPNLKKDPKKEIVLVIDDLDRIDPEHIFRILNVFACHLSLGDSTNNKFGFNKIILVCDIENIRNIFHSKYGTSTDFSGYIDKFFSKEIFYFDNKKVINDTIDSILESISLPNNYDNYFSFVKKGRSDYSLLKEILQELINNNLLNLRSLLKIHDQDYMPNRYFIKIDYNKKIENYTCSMIFIFDFLSIIYGSKKNLEIALKSLASKNQIRHETTEDALNFKNYGDLVELVDIKRHNFSLHPKHLYQNVELNIKIEYHIIRNGHSYVTIIDGINHKEIDIVNEFNFPFRKLLYLAFQNYITLDIADN
ncbi:P-loop NTPase fold protein [Chondrinema litorale]|uniref:P-loop NTPase fold protein n=1 Tax=Chondrinema litorale TaxID=2994555 RepID=UPI002543C723|nr:P-loop NTPase fold protein [Chondrinema litorale]UZR93147.1 P-loop NTPase fold protein [Chondrinema litorale]